MHLGHAFVEIHVFHTHVKVATICAEGVPLLATICAETTICDDLSRHKLSSIKRCRRRHLSSGDKLCRNTASSIKQTRRRGVFLERGEITPGMSSEERVGPLSWPPVALQAAVCQPIQF